MQKFKYANDEEFLEAFGEKLAEVQQNNPNSKLNIDQIFDVYLSVAECVRVVYSDTYEKVLFPDYEYQTYMSDHWSLHDVLCLVCQASRLSIRPSISKAKKLLEENFRDPAKVRQAVPAPSRLIITKDGNIYDMIDRKYVDYDPHFYYTVSYDIDPFEKIDISSEYYQAATLLLDSWSQFDMMRLHRIHLVIFLALYGYNAESFVLVTGKAGSGKSAFIRMLSNLVGEYAQVFDFCNIHDNRFLKSVDPNARMLYSYLMPDDFTFNKSATERLKALISSDTHNIETTKKCARALTNCGLKIQEAYILPSYTLEPGESIEDRLTILDFGSVNHRRDDTVEKQLLALTGKPVSKLIEDKQFLNIIQLIVLQKYRFSL